MRAFFADDTQFVVPGFQPPYRWEHDAWQAILDSLETPSRGEHFLGALVSMPLGTTPGGLNKALLIDGQHRLATVLMLLAALRDRLRQLGASGTALQWAREGLENARQSGANRFKLLPATHDRADFESIMLGEPPRGKGLPVQAYRHFYAATEGFSKAETEDAVRVLMTRFVVVHIQLEKNEDPYPIFKSLSAPEQPFTRAGLKAYYRFSSDPELMAWIAGGESQEVEFKVSVFPQKTGNKDDFRGSLNLVRSVAGFLNSANGGMLILGVRDDGSIRGIEPDYLLADAGKPNWDGYQLFLQNVLRSRLSIPNAFLWYQIERRSAGDRKVAVIHVQPAPGPVYVDKHLYVRAGNQTLDMQGPELVRYVTTRWPETRELE